MFARVVFDVVLAWRWGLAFSADGSFSFKGKWVEYGRRTAIGFARVRMNSDPILKDAMVGMIV